MLNDTTLVVCMIETQEAVRNLDEIATVKGVDVLHIGCKEFLGDLGKPGEFECAEITRAIEKVISAGRKHGVFIGLGGDKDLSRQARWTRAGVRFITTQSDMAMLMTDGRTRTAELRTALSRGSAERLP